MDWTVMKWSDDFVLVDTHIYRILTVSPFCRSYFYRSKIVVCAGIAVRTLNLHSIIFPVEQVSILAQTLNLYTLL